MKSMQNPLNTERQVKQVSDIIGEWGRWQSNIAFCCITVAIFSAFNNLASAFYAPNIDYYCAQPDDALNETFFNSSLAEKCFPNATEVCQEWVYDKSVFQNTIVDEWGLVCDRAWLSSLSQSVYMSGIVFSALIFGHYSDKYGRKPIIWISVAIEITAGLASAFSPTITIFIISRFFVSFGCYGRNLTGFLLAIETVGPKYRAIMGIAVQLGWALGYIMLPGISYLTVNFRYMLLATTLPELLWVVWLWFIPESPRWQVAHGQFVKAEAEIKRALKINGRSVANLELDFIMLRESMEKERCVNGVEGQNFLDLWKTRSMRKYTLVFYFTWFVNAFVYYGISLNIGDLGGDLFWNFFFAGLVEFPSYFFCMYIFKYIGRRPLLAMMMYGAGFSCLGVIPFVMSESYHWAITTLAMLGKFCITSSFGIIYVYSAEVYPTVLRQIGVGSCSVAGRVGSIIAPFMKELSFIASFGVTMGMFGALSVLVGLVCVMLPETRDRDIPDTLEDVENYDKDCS